MPDIPTLDELLAVVGDDGLESYLESLEPDERTTFATNLLARAKAEAGKSAKAVKQLSSYRERVKGLESKLQELEQPATPHDTNDDTPDAPQGDPEEASMPDKSTDDPRLEALQSQLEALQGRLEAQQQALVQQTIANTLTTAGMTPAQVKSAAAIIRASEGAYVSGDGDAVQVNLEQLITDHPILEPNAIPGVPVGARGESDEGVGDIIDDFVTKAYGGDGK